ncbi:MAG: hypothetical protein AAFV98_20730 [Chloroflexota bacterium]
MFGKLEYPPARKDDVIDNFFGTDVPDPYRWLEDADTDEVIAWTQTQSDFAEEILGSLAGRDAFKKRLTEVWDYPKYGIPRKYGNRLFFTKNDGLQAQPTLYVQDENSEPRVLIDPNTLSDDGTVALVDWQATTDGKYLMYALSESGLDWRTFKIRDVDTGNDLEDTLTNIKFSSASWRKDHSGFYYSKFPDDTQDEGDNNQSVSHQMFFHALGTSQSDDVLVYEHPDLTGVNLSPFVSHDGKYLLVYVSGDSFVFNRLYYREIDSDGDFVRLFDKLDASYSYVSNDDDIFYIATTKDAPNKRVVTVDLKQPNELRDVIPESENVIQGVVVANNQFVATYMRDAHHVIKVFEKDGTFSHDIELPTLGSTGLWAGTSKNGVISCVCRLYFRILKGCRYDINGMKISVSLSFAM